MPSLLREPDWPVLEEPVLEAGVLLIPAFDSSEFNVPEGDIVSVLNSPVFCEPVEDVLLCGHATKVVITPVDAASTVVIIVVIAHIDDSLALALEGAG